MSKSTDAFKEAIKKAMDMKAFKNPLFEAKYKNPEKSLDECVNYILNTVQKSGANGFADDEVYGMAVHYYSEKNIKAGKKTNATVVINRSVKLTEKEKEELKQEAKERVIAEEMAKLRGKDKKPKATPVTKDDEPQTLFG